MKLSRQQLKKLVGGFTLVETLVAIAILTIAVSVGMGALQQSLQTTSLVRDQSTAYFLAEEAIEYVRSVRDTNTLSGASWLTNLSQCEGGKLCSVDATNNTNTGVALCGQGGQPTCVLYFTGSIANSTAGLYDGDTTGAISKFTRTVTLTPISTNTNGDEVLVTATVSWVSGPFSHQSFTVKDELYNWQN